MPSIVAMNRRTSLFAVAFGMFVPDEGRIVCASTRKHDHILLAMDEAGMRARGITRRYSTLERSRS
jgi:hypothetical protein